MLAIAMAGGVAPLIALLFYLQWKIDHAGTGMKENCDFIDELADLSQEEWCHSPH